MTARPIIVAYDISDHRTRRRVYKILKQWRLDGQKSVHECLLKQGQAEELFLQLGQAIDSQTDRLLMAWLETRRPLFTEGKGQPLLLETLRHIH